MKPELWLIAGPNGSGKTTFYYQRLSSHIPIFVNADEIAQGLGRDPDNAEATDYRAAELAEERRLELIKTGKTFAAETVFSHPSKVTLLQMAKTSGYITHLVFIATENPEINVERVAHRVRRGGHNVSTDKVISRYERSLENLVRSIVVADNIYIVDNSEKERPHRLAMKIEQGKTTFISDTLPLWIKRLFPN
jgi:predicted ABC-type ATPase